MSAESSIPTKPRQSRLWVTIKALLRARILAGLIVVLPIWVSWLLVRAVFGLMRDSSAWVVHLFVSSQRLESLALARIEETVPAAWRAWTGLPDVELARQTVIWSIAIFSVFLTVFLLYTIGLLTANIVGRRLIETMENLLDRVPLVKTVYRSIKQILTAFSTDATQSFQRVALIKFPSEHSRAPAFVTNIFKDAVTGEDMCAVFYPTTPNPTTGYMLVVRRSDLIEVNWSIEEAFQAIISCGMLTPPGVSFDPRVGRWADASPGGAAPRSSAPPGAQS